MEEYFRISNETRTLEQQYTDILVSKLRLETELVEEDYCIVAMNHREEIRRMEDDESRRREEVESLREVVEQLSRDKIEKEESVVQLIQEKEDLTDKLEKLQDRMGRENGEGRENVKKLKKEIKDLGEVLKKKEQECVKMEELNSVLRSAEGNLQEIVRRLQEDGGRWQEGLDRIGVEIGALKSSEESIRQIKEMASELVQLGREDRSAQCVNEIVEVMRKEVDQVRGDILRMISSCGISEEVKELRESNRRLREENAALAQNQRLMVEKDQVINVLKEGMKQKDEVIGIQRKAMEGMKTEARREGVLEREDVPRGESDNGLVSLENEYNIGKKNVERLWDDVPIRPKPSQQKIETNTSRKRTVAAKEKRPGVRGGPKASGQATKKNVAKRSEPAKSAECKEVPTNEAPATQPKKLVAPVSLLKPENSSYFADLTFNNSSPIIKKSRFNPPKKK